MSSPPLDCPAGTQGGVRFSPCPWVCFPDGHPSLCGYAYPGAAMLQANATAAMKNQASQNATSLRTLMGKCCGSETVEQISNQCPTFWCAVGGDSSLNSSQWTDCFTAGGGRDLGAGFFGATADSGPASATPGSGDASATRLGAATWMLVGLALCAALSL